MERYIKIKGKCLKIVYIYLLLLSCQVIKNPDTSAIKNISEEKTPINKDWTIMLYLGADNNLEYDLLRNVKQIKESYKGGCNVIIFIDRSPGYSVNKLTFGENFIGGRIYRVLKNNNIELIDKGEIFNDIPEIDKKNIDSSNILVLKKFIEYCKSNYTAKYYGLIIGSHGGGARGIEKINNKRNIIFDEANNSWIYNAMFTESLNNSHSVDILGMDACFMGNMEFLYQIRCGNASFNAKYVVASPPTEWSYGWNYAGIIKRISGVENCKSTDTGEISKITEEKKYIYSSKSLTPKDLGKIIIEEQYDYTSLETDDQILVLYDTEKIGELKKNFDSLFVSLKDNSSDIEQLRGSDEIVQNDILLYFNSSSTSEWIDYCYFDVYDIVDKIVKSSKFSEEINIKAEIVKENVDSLILYSFSGDYFKKFKTNITGLSFFFPAGNRIYKDKKMWYYQTFYNPKPDESTFGKLSFCKDNATENNKIVENYFEVLDYWFDEEDGKGGYNGYSY